jgi:hypothetical protein
MLMVLFGYTLLILARRLERIPLEGLLADQRAPVFYLRSFFVDRIESALPVGWSVGAASDEATIWRPHVSTSTTPTGKTSLRD